MAVLDSVAEPVGFHLAVHIAGPSHHSVGIGIVEKDTSRCGHFTDILAEFKHCMNPPLAVHDTADTQGVPHTLIHPIV